MGSSKDIYSVLQKGQQELQEAIELAVNDEDVSAGIKVKNLDGVKMSLNVWRGTSGNIEVLQDVEATQVQPLWLCVIIHV